MPEWVVSLPGAVKILAMVGWKIVGHGAEAFVYFYINGKAVSFSDRQVDLSAYKGEIDLKATTDNGGVTKLKVIR